MRKIGDEFFTFIVDCADAKACSIVLRGASKDVLNEVERNLHDAMGVARNVCIGACARACAVAVAGVGVAVAGCGGRLRGAWYPPTPTPTLPALPPCPPHPPTHLPSCAQTRGWCRAAARWRWR